MKTIAVTAYTSTGLDPALAKASSIEVEDKPLGQGGFGIAYRARSFDGRKVNPQVIKILTDTVPGVAQHGFGTIRDLQKRIDQENRKASGKLLQQLPALQAIPQLSFEGRLDGQSVLGYSSNNLTHLGFEEFGHILDDDAKYAAFQAIPISAKLRIAGELVSAFDFLASQIQFIHADFKPEALFVDLKGMHCAVIDFDSGALARDANDEPTTYGTQQDWLAPEIARQLASPGNANRRIKVNLHSDVWSVNVAIHYLLFGMHPLFFLSEISDRSTAAYFKQYQWPDIDPRFAFFRKEPEVAAAYPVYLRSLRSMSQQEIVRRLAFTINKGFVDPNARTSYGQWKRELGVANQPGIRRFSADRTLVSDGRPVHLTWDVVGAARLELSGVGDVTNRTSADVTVTRDTRFELVLVTSSGARMSKSIGITVDKKPPAIAWFRTSAPVLTSATPARLTWSVSGAARIQIDHGVGDVTLQSHADVSPRADTTYTLTATSYFGVTASATVEVRISNVPPSIAYFRADAALLEGGRPLTLSWEVSPDAHEVTISGIGTVQARGTKVLDQRQRETFVLTARSYFGARSEARVQVDVSRAAPVIHQFYANPKLFREGVETLLTWNASGAERVRLDPGGVDLPPSGSHAMRPSQTTRFTLQAVSWYGVTATQHADVSVVRKASLTARPVMKLDPSRITRLPPRH